MQANVLGRDLAAGFSSATNSLPNSEIKQTSFAGIVSQCAKMQKIFGIMERVAKTYSTVLILGESGTGKELVARAIHQVSGRTGKLVPVNCGAIPEEILESELFGHEKGSFTGAVASRIGRFQMAEGGTIFLDEIGEMSPKLQVKLLRVLQERKVEPVGSTRTIDVDVRIIAATNKNLEEEVKAGRFREDLFYRLQVVPIKLPSLRERGQDVGVLARYFLERACNAIGRTPIRLTAEAEAKLCGYQWPGNIRQLENLLERIAVLHESDTLLESDLPEHILSGPKECSVVETTETLPMEGLDFNEVVNQFEVKLITLALQRTGGNKKAAAKLLQLNRTTLVEKIKKKGLENRIEVVIEDDQDQAV